MVNEETQVIEEVEEQLEEKHYFEEAVYEDADTDTLRERVLQLIETDEGIREKIIETLEKKKRSLFARIVGAIVEYLSGPIGGELAQDVAEWVEIKIKECLGYSAS